MYPKIIIPDTENPKIAPSGRAVNTARPGFDLTQHITAYRPTITIAANRALRSGNSRNDTYIAAKYTSVVTFSGGFVSVSSATKFPRLHTHTMPAISGDRRTIKRKKAAASFASVDDEKSVFSPSAIVTSSGDVARWCTVLECQRALIQ
jgi:hypothetical protein